MIQSGAARGKYPLLLVIPLISTLLLVSACKTEQSSPVPPSSSSSSSSPPSSPSSGSSGPESSPGTTGSASMPSAPAPAGSPGTTPSSSAGMPGSGAELPMGSDAPGASAGNEGMPAGSPGAVSPGDMAADPSAGTPGSASASGPGVTTDEAVGQIDAQLDASLAVFDGMILTERRAAQTMGGGSDAGMAGSGPDDGEVADAAEGSDGPLFEEADLSEPGINGGETTVPDMPSGESANNTIAGGPGSGHGNVPADLVDGSDDDIVARQIREAAMNESDPELREKLWDEYRKYKKGQ